MNLQSSHGHMKNIVATGCGLALALGSVSANAKPWAAIPSDVKTPSAPLVLAAHLAQNELRVGEDPTIVYGNPQYGLVGGLMLGALMSSQSKKDRADAEPLIAAMSGFDADTPLMKGIRKGISKLTWLSLTSQSPSRNNSLAAKSEMLDQATGKFLGDIDCSYAISPFYVMAHATCWVQVAAKDKPAQASPESRWAPGKLLFYRTVTAQVILDISQNAPCYKAECRQDRKSLWAANSAAHLRAQLAILLQKVGDLAGRELALTENEIKAAVDQKDRQISFFPHDGFVLEGYENVVDPGRKPGMWKGAKAAIIKPDNAGVLMMDATGNLLHRRSISLNH